MRLLNSVKINKYKTFFSKIFKLLFLRDYVQIWTTTKIKVSSFKEINMHESGNDINALYINNFLTQEKY